MTNVLGTPLARGLVLLFWLSGCAQFVALWGDLANHPLLIIALAYLLVGLLIQTSPRWGSLGLFPVIVLVCMPPTVAALVSIAGSAHGQYFEWALHLSGFSMGMLMIQGSLRLAICGTVAMVLVAVPIMLVAGETPLFIGVLLTLPFVELLVGGAWRIGVRALDRRTQAHRSREARLLARDAAVRAATQRMRGDAAEIRALVSPLFRVVADGGTLSEAELRDCAVLEACLRERIRAPRLATPAVAAAAAAARRRGVEVSLRDDAGPSSGALTSVQQAAIVELLGESARGTLHVRLDDAHGMSRVTIVLEDGSRTRRLSVPTTAVAATSDSAESRGDVPISGSSGPQK